MKSPDLAPRQLDRFEAMNPRQPCAGSLPEFDVTDFLKTEMDAFAYLMAALQDDDDAMLPVALEDIGRSAQAHPVPSR